MLGIYLSTFASCTSLIQIHPRRCRIDKGLANYFESSEKDFFQFKRRVASFGLHPTYFFKDLLERPNKKEKKDLFDRVACTNVDEISVQIQTSPLDAALSLIPFLSSRTIIIKGKMIKEN